MNTIVRKAVSVKRHVARHKGAYAMGTVAAAAIVLQQRNLKAFYAFLEEKGIDPMEFYGPEMYAEINNS